MKASRSSSMQMAFGNSHFSKGFLQKNSPSCLIRFGTASTPKIDDDDIVTRLWSKNLSTITLVTAEEIAKSSTGGRCLCAAYLAG